MGNSLKVVLTQCLPTKIVNEHTKHTEDIKRLVDINMNFLESLDDDDNDCVILEYSKKVGVFDGV